MGNLLDAFIRSLLRDAMTNWIHVSRRTGKSIGPPDGGGIEDDVAFGAIVDRGGVMARVFAVDERLAFRNDLHAGPRRGFPPLTIRESAP